MLPGLPFATDHQLRVRWCHSLRHPQDKGRLGPCGRPVGRRRPVMRLWGLHDAR